MKLEARAHVCFNQASLRGLSVSLIGCRFVNNLIYHWTFTRLDFTLTNEKKKSIKRIREIDKFMKTISLFGLECRLISLS